MKVKTRIEEIETHNTDGTPKKASNGSVFARFKTSRGWATCFDVDIIETLKRLKANTSVNHEVVLELEETEKQNKFGKTTTYRHIKGIYPDGMQEEEDDFTDAVVRVNKQEKVQENGSKEQFKVSGSKDATFYTSYAKDLMIAYMSNLPLTALESLDFSVTMAQCVGVINSAKEVFS